MGPIQRKWVDSLRAHPERQGRTYLAQGTEDNYIGCCLGEYLIVYNKEKGIACKFTNRLLIADPDNCASLPNFEEFGLYSPYGDLKDSSYSLASMNDNHKTWLEIANFIEANESLVFSKEV
jgi:hypothetical protein